MATDSTLVKGAYEASKGYDIDRTGVSGAINKRMKGLGKAVEKRKGRQEEAEAKRQEELQKEKEFNEGLQKGINRAEQIAYDTEDDSYGEDEEEIITSMGVVDVEASETTDNTSPNNKDNEITLATKKSWENAEDSLGIDFAYDNIRDIVEQQKESIEPSKLKETGIKVLNTLSNGVQKFKGLKERMLKLNRGRRKGTGLSKGIDVKTDAALAGIASGNIPLETNTINGEVQLGFRINDEYLSLGDIERLLDDNQVDLQSQASIIDIRDAQISLAENARPESVFNREKVRSSITEVVSKGNLKSLVHDETFGGTSFAEDILKSDFAGMTYGSLGLSDIYDTDGDGKLTSNDNLSTEDKKAIVEELINNPNNASLLEEEVTNYFTAHIQKNWEMNHKNRPQSNPLPGGSMMNTYKPEQQVGAPSLQVDLPGVPKRALSEEEKLKARLTKKNESGYSTMDYLNMINI
tara:strand:- start:216 stop:1610 length:1395 start_codon:yes stop_codon:yes gene_type:complete